MKKLFTFLVAVFVAATVWAQSPEKMSYQSVIRNSSDALVTNTQVGMQICILHGSASGTAVYIETQTPTTNANGLVSLEIGTGAVVSGDFTNIDWANGPYFIKSETDPAGGTSYTITGTSQLLSVPYALHAKTAETVTGGITETDPVFTAWDKDYNDLINKPAKPSEADGSETKVTAGTNVTVTGAGTTASPYVVNATGTTALTIGQSYQGGIIFWLDSTGQHGLIAATADCLTKVKWYDSNTFANARRNGIGAGMYNTERIIRAFGEGTYPAQICANYQGGGYGDWYLPSAYELKLLYYQKVVVGSFASYNYWSSTEIYGGAMSAVHFGNGLEPTVLFANTCNVRAIRAF